jgi:lipoprotein-releasing system ATP-binding protein
MLTAEGIYKSYGDLEILKGVYLHVNKSEILSIVGKSGTGKSTLLHILGTLDLPDSGKIIIDNQNSLNLKPKELAAFRNQKIGFIFQFHHLLAEFTALENVCIPAYIKGVNKFDAEKKAKTLLDYLGLKNRISHKPNELSGGEQQRVAIARALVNDPKIVFADEPSGNLDNQTSDELHSLFSSLRNDLGHTFVIVTHNVDLANLSDRKLTMTDGILN